MPHPRIPTGQPESTPIPFAPMPSTALHATRQVLQSVPTSPDDPSSPVSVAPGGRAAVPLIEQVSNGLNGTNRYEIYAILGLYSNTTLPILPTPSPLHGLNHSPHAAVQAEHHQDPGRGAWPPRQPPPQPGSEAKRRYPGPPHRRRILGRGRLRHQEPIRHAALKRSISSTPSRIQFDYPHRQRPPPPGTSRAIPDVSRNLHRSTL